MISENLYPEPWTGQPPAPLVGTIHRIKFTREPFDILICGWRAEWNDAKRFARRIEAITETIPDDSVLSFLNRLSNEEFEERMAMLEKSESNWLFNGVTIKHLAGDSADPAVLYKVMKETQFEAAIVLGTLVGTDLPPISRDRRVQMTMALLRATQRTILR